MKTNVNVMMGLVAASLLGPASALAQTCPSFEELAKEALPLEVGDAGVMERMLSASAKSSLSASFDATAASRNVGDELSPDISCTSTRCEYRNTNGSTMRVDLSRGKVTYLNRKRSELNQSNTLSEGAAYEVAWRAAGNFGVPLDELDQRATFVRALRASSFDRDAGRASSARTELHVWMQRQVQGFPVLGSKVHAAVDPSGQVARLHVRWSDFRLAPRLSASSTLSRDKVYEELVMQLRGSNTPCSLAGVRARVAYVPSRLIEGGTGVEEEKVYSTAPVSVDEYVPALVVHATPVGQPEDSGRVTEGGQELVVPLLGGREE
jgi:hypothetical protein